MALFTAETAVIAAKKSHAPDSARFIKSEPPQPEPARPQPAEIPADDYLQRRIARVRVQLDKLDGMIECEIDPQKIDRLASAIGRLAELERQMSGRPLPGSFRPMQDRSGRSKGRAVEVWSEPTTQPNTLHEPASTTLPGPENG